MLFRNTIKQANQRRVFLLARSHAHSLIQRVTNNKNMEIIFADATQSSSSTYEQEEDDSEEAV